MARLRCLSLALTLAAVLTIGRTASADPIPITSGYLTVSGAQNFDSRGFLRTIFYDFSSDSFRLRGGVGDGNRQNVFSPSLVVPSYWTPSMGAEALVAPSSDLVFTTTPGFAPMPFQLSGTISIFDHPSGMPLTSYAVSGSGTATWQFALTPGGSPVPSGVSYVFQDVAQTPEPATLVLLAAGLGMAAAHRRRANRTG